MKNWNPDRPHTVTLRYKGLHEGLDDTNIGPVWQWQQVMSLDLSHNKLRVLPEVIDLPNLRDLNLSYNEIITLPNQLLLLPKLVSLDLSHNGLEALPDIDLPIYNNEAETISTQRHLPCLTSLDLSNNDLHDVAPTMKHLCGPYSKLQSLELKGNIFLKVPPSQILESGGEKVCQFFKDLARGRTICWSQTVLVVGQEEAGKTALCRALSGYRCADHAQLTEASTVGIDIVRWSTVVAIPITSRSTHRQSHRLMHNRIALHTRILVATLVNHRVR